jgi:hypothetical protein
VKEEARGGIMGDGQVRRGGSARGSDNAIVNLLLGERSIAIIKADVGRDILLDPSDCLTW